MLLLDADLLVASAIQQVTDGFASQDNVTLDESDASWSPAPTSIYVKDPQFTPAGYDPGKTKLLLGAISITIEGTSHKVCDIGFSASATVGLEVNQPNVVKTTTRLDWSPNYWDAFWCLGPIGGLLAGGLLDIIASATNPADLTGHFAELSWVVDVAAQGDTKATVVSRDGLIRMKTLAGRERDDLRHVLGLQLAQTVGVL